MVSISCLLGKTQSTMRHRGWRMGHKPDTRAGIGVKAIKSHAY